MAYYDIDIFSEFKKHLDDDDEVCASIEYQPNGEFKIQNFKNGFSQDYFDEFENKILPQKMCSQENHVWNIHTHPKSNYAYPSFVDLKRVIEFSIPGSFIVSRWGVWGIQNVLKKPHLISPSQEARLKEILDDLGLSTRVRTLPRSKEYSIKIHKQIDVFLKKINRMYLPIKVHFDSWTKLEFRHPSKSRSSNSESDWESPN